MRWKTTGLATSQHSLLQDVPVPPENTAPYRENLQDPWSHFRSDTSPNRDDNLQSLTYMEFPSWNFRDYYPNYEDLTRFILIYKPRCI